MQLKDFLNVSYPSCSIKVIFWKCFKIYLSLSMKQNLCKYWNIFHSTLMLKGNCAASVKTCYLHRTLMLFTFFLTPKICLSIPRRNFNFVSKSSILQSIPSALTTVKDNWFLYRIKKSKASISCLPYWFEMKTMLYFFYLLN